MIWMLLGDGWKPHVYSLFSQQSSYHDAIGSCFLSCLPVVTSNMGVVQHRKQQHNVLLADL